MDELIPIGRFSRVSRLSIRMLRRYDDEGLLSPARVDPTSGYRYYGAEQVRRAELIRVLRAVDMPLAHIRELLATDDSATIAARLAEHRERLAERVAEQERALLFLERLIERGHLAMYDITIREIAAHRVARRRLRTDFATIGDTVGAGFAELARVVYGSGIAPAGPPYVVYLDVIDEETDGEVAVCMPVPPASNGPTDGGVEWADVDALQAATTTHRGPYAEVSGAYEAMAVWLQETDRELAGPPREVYLNDPRQVASAELLTELQFPVAG